MVTVDFLNAEVGLMSPSQTPGMFIYEVSLVVIPSTPFEKEASVTTVDLCGENKLRALCGAFVPSVVHTAMTRPTPLLLPSLKINFCPGTTA